MHESGLGSFSPANSVLPVKCAQQFFSLQFVYVLLLLLGVLVQRSCQGFLTGGLEQNHGNQIPMGGSGQSHGGMSGYHDNMGYQDSGNFRGSGSFQGPGNFHGPFQGSGNFHSHGNFQEQGNFQGQSNFQGRGNFQGQGGFHGPGNYQGQSNFQRQGPFQDNQGHIDSRSQSSGSALGHHGVFGTEPHVSIQPASVKVVYVPVVSTSIKASSLSKLTSDHALSKNQNQGTFHGSTQQSHQQQGGFKSSTYPSGDGVKQTALGKTYSRSSSSGHATIPIIIIQKEHHQGVKSQQGGGYQVSQVQSTQTQGQGFSKQSYSSSGSLQPQQHQQQQQQQFQQQRQPDQQYGFGATARHAQGAGAVIPVIIIQKSSPTNRQSSFTFQAGPPPVRGPNPWSPWR